ncbi:MAG TPA: hypothetical protein VN408_09200 [Actinoplanes sp.]|nr:hypothetical protein [Actinoplanes sp.]
MQAFWRAPDAPKGGTGPGQALAGRLAEAGGGRLGLHEAHPAGLDAQVVLTARRDPGYRLAGPWADLGSCCGWDVLTTSRLVILAGLDWPVPGPADFVYFVAYPMLAAASALWARNRGGQDAIGGIDVMVIVVGLATPAWPVLLDSGA